MLTLCLVYVIALWIWVIRNIFMFIIVLAGIGGLDIMPQISQFHGNNESKRFRPHFIAMSVKLLWMPGLLLCVKIRTLRLFIRYSLFHSFVTLVDCCHLDSQLCICYFWHWKTQRQGGFICAFFMVMVVMLKKNKYM